MANWDYNKIAWDLCTLMPVPLRSDRGRDGIPARNGDVEDCSDTQNALRSRGPKAIPNVWVFHDPHIAQQDSLRVSHHMTKRLSYNRFELIARLAVIWERPFSSPISSSCPSGNLRPFV